MSNGGKELTRADGKSARSPIDGIAIARCCSLSLSREDGVDHDHDQSDDFNIEITTPLDLNEPMTQRRRQPKPFEQKVKT